MSAECSEICHAGLQGSEAIGDFWFEVEWGLGSLSLTLLN